MSFGDLSRIVITDRPANVAGATVYDEIEQWLDVEWTEARDLSDQATLRVPYSARARAALKTRRVINLIGEPNSQLQSDLLAYRIYNTTVRRSKEGLVLTAEARSMWFDLTDAGVMTVPLSGGTHETTIAATLDFFQWATTFGLPHLQRQGYTWYTTFAGPVNTFERGFDRWTFAQLLESLREELGDGYRLFLDPATWALSLVQVAPGTSSDPLPIEPGHNLLGLEDAESAQEQATIIEPLGGKGHSRNSRTIQHFAFGASNLNAGLKTFQPWDLAETGFPGPVIQFDGQYVDPSGARVWYVQRVDTGRCHKITATTASGGGTFTLEDWPAKPGPMAFELREALTPATPLDVNAPGRPLRVSAAPAGAVLTLDDPLNAGDPVPTDDVHLDHAVRVSALQLATTCSNIVTVAGSTTDQDLTLASTAGLAVGDWGFLHNNVAVPWGLFGAVVTIVQLVSAFVVRVRVRYTWATGLPFTPGVVAKQARFYRVRAGLRTFCIDEVAAANTITVTNPATIASQDLVEYFLENSGARLTGIPAPSLLDVGVVRKERTFDASRCCRNLLATINGLKQIGNTLLDGNPHFDDWPVGQPAPTGWVIASGSATRTTANLPGPGLVHAVGLNGTIRSPVMFARPTAADSAVSVRVQLRTPIAASWSGPAGHQFIVFLASPAGSQFTAFAYLVPEDTPAPPANAKKAAPDTVVTFDVLALDLFHAASPPFGYAPVDGFRVVCSGFVTLGGVFVTEDSTLPESTYLPNRGDQSLFGAGNIGLDDVDLALRNVRADAIDLGRLAAAQYPSHELGVDRLLRHSDEELGLAVERRIALLRRRATPAGTVTVDVETQQRRFTDLLAKQFGAT